MLVISEHQSSINPNMPLRSIIYYRRTVEKLVEARNIYREKQMKIPTPEFYVFYNGDRAVPREETLRLSDSYIDKRENPMLELKVKVIDINLPANHELLMKCRPLYEYSWFIQKIKEYLASGRDRDGGSEYALHSI
ncbi:MAG: hypothetical protein NC123_19120 [Butyrivibrio sp.]|nr:hypothetical protein [Butyrivibrio sp.]